MATKYLTITQEDIDAKVAQGIQALENELLGYEHYVDNHQSAMEALGDIKWDDTTKEYHGLTRDVFIARAIKNGLDSTAIQKVADLLDLEEHKRRAAEGSVEITKVTRLYNNALIKLPAGDARDAAFATITKTK